MTPTTGVEQNTSLANGPSIAGSMPAWEVACLNCGTDLAGPFCSECGQRVVPPHPTLRELAGDAFAEFSGWDGKLAETMRALLLRPGQLTLEFLEGRRVSYIAPLRLYLIASFVYFALSAAAPNIRSNAAAVATIDGQTMSLSTGTSETDLSDEDRQEIEKKIATVGPVFGPVLRRVVTDTKAFQTDVFNAMPKALFALLPVFAGILKLFYPKRRFADHLYFALHVHAFSFVALSANALAKFTHVSLLATAVGVIVLLGVPVYWHRALRRVYGGTLGGTLGKELGIGALYTAASIPVLVGLAVWVSRG